MPATSTLQPSYGRAFPARFLDAIKLVPLRTWIGGAIAVGLWWIFMHYTRWPAVQNKSQILTILATGAPNTFTEMMSREGWSYWLSWIPTGVNMFDNNAIGMAFAFLIGGAVSTLVLPAGLVQRLLSARGPLGAIFGGLLGAPLMMCSACSVPIAMGWKRRGANTETTLGVIMGASLLNIMGLLTISLLFPDAMAWGRVVGSVLMVGAVTPLVARLATKLAPAMPSEVACPLPVSETKPESFRQAFAGTLKDWWWSSVEVAYRFFVPMTIAMFVAAMIRLFVSTETVTTYFGSGLLAIAAVSLFGTLIAVPTMFEIPLAIGFIFLGMGYGPAAALLITAPSVSIVSYFMMRKETGSLPPVLLLTATFLMGIAVGLAVENF